MDLLNKIATIALLVTALAACGGGSGGGEPEIDEVLFKLDEVNGATINSTPASSFTGQIIGASRVVGKVNNALYFGDNLPSYVSLPLFVEYPSDEISIEAWVKFESLDASAEYAFYGDQYFGVKSFILDVIDGQFRFTLFTTPTGSDSIELLRTNYIFGLDTWYYVAFTFGGTGPKFYVNGVLNESASTISTIFNAVNTQYLGGLSTFDNGMGTVHSKNSFPGYIDEFRLSRRERTSSEISAYYASTM